MILKVVVEKANGNLSAYVQDLPGCVATGKDEAELLERIRHAIAWHIAGLIEDQQPIPCEGGKTQIIMPELVPA